MSIRGFPPQSGGAELPTDFRERKERSGVDGEKENPGSLLISQPFMDQNLTNWGIHDFL